MIDFFDHLFTPHGKILLLPEGIKNGWEKSSEKRFSLPTTIAIIYPVLNLRIMIKNKKNWNLKLPPELQKRGEGLSCRSRKNSV
jgi:hypothetical protein